MIASLRDIGRLVRTLYVFAREGVLALIDPEPLPVAARAGLGLLRLIERGATPGTRGRLPAALTRLGPTYIKLGQFLATRPDVVGDTLAADLASLQDRLPPFPQPAAEAMVEANLQKPLRAVFETFGPAVAAASIAQVHRATLRTADGLVPVAVKVLRPDVRQRFATDIAAMKYLARLAERALPASRRLRPVAAVNDFHAVVTLETDLRMEAAALSELADNTRDDPGLVIPDVKWDLTGRDVLVTDWIDGIALSNHAALDAAGHDRAALARLVMQTFLRLALRDGFFHGDMHPGNLFALTDGRLAMVDCGIMGRLGIKERRFLAEILYGFITRDYARVAEVHFEAGYVPAHHSVAQFSQAVRAIGEPIYDRPARDISMAKLLTLLFEITEIFEMQTRTELVLLQKTMIVVEGVARALDPQFDMWRASEPVVREWIERNLGVTGHVEQIARGARDLARIAADVPEMAQRLDHLVARAELASRRGLVLAPETVKAMADAQARHGRWTAMALWVIAATLLAFLWIIR